ncbi:MAG: PEGA domain-containing protein [Lachnospiraceae bacterium]|nr:PEGA domain-containing protein [Lachnospiraceae bacterium]
MGNNREKPIIIISVAVLAIITIAILFGTGVIDFDKKNSSDTGEEAVPSGTVSSVSTQAGDRSATDPTLSPDLPVPLPAGPGKYTCIIRGIDLDGCMIELYDIDSGSDLEYTFTAATDIRTSYGKSISSALLKVGDIVVVETSDGTKLDSINGEGDFKTHKDVMRFKIDKSIGRITAGNTVYKYDDRLLILDGVRFINIDDLNSLDVISLYHKDNTVFFIKVVSSHGFLSFTGSEDFEGGTITISGVNTSYQLTQDLSIPLSVGDYSVYVDNLELSASADIRIESHKTAVFDLSPFGRVPITYGDVTFNINPEGALLYIDGVNTLYNEPVSIPEGSHSVRVELGGYISFSGTIQVSSTGGTFNISLPPAPVNIETPPEDILYNETDEGDDYIDSDDDIDSEASDTSEETDSSHNDFIFDDTTSDPSDPSEDNTDSAALGSDDNTEGIVSSNGQKLIISCTEGTSVYVNGTHVSTVSGGSAVSEKPRPGTVTVRLVLDGYISRTYTVTIEDDGEDAEFTFPDMVKQ